MRPFFSEPPHVIRVRARPRGSSASTRRVLQPALDARGAPARARYTGLKMVKIETRVAR